MNMATTPQPTQAMVQYPVRPRQPHSYLVQVNDRKRHLITRVIIVKVIFLDSLLSSLKTYVISMCPFKDSASSENTEPKGSFSTLNESESPSSQLQQEETKSQVN